MAGTRKRLVYALFSLVVTAGIFAWLFSHVTPSEVAGLLRNVDPRGVALFLLASFTMSLFRLWRYLVVLRVSGYAPGRLALFLVVLVRNTFSDFLPARLGTLVYIYIVTARLGIPFGAATASFALAFVFDMMALAPLIAWAALSLGGGPLWALIGFGALLAGVMAAALAMLPRLVGLGSRWLGRLAFLGAARIGRWRDGLAALTADLRKARQAGIYGKVLVLSIMVRVFKYASLYFFLFALVAPLGYGWSSLPPARAFAGLCAAEAAASLPVSGIAGFGAYEGAWALVFRLLLFPAQLAKSTSIAHHLFTQIYGYSLGLAALLLLLLPFRRTAAAARPSPPTRGGALRFAAQCALALASFAALATLLYRTVPAAAAAPAAGAPYLAPIVPGEAEAAALRELESRMDGWIVYERPQGIFKTRIGTLEPVRLASPGRFPRWSPDGRHVAFLQEDRLMLMQADGSGQQILARVREPRALAFHPSGAAVYFTDGTLIRAVDIESRAVRDVASGFRFRELDVAPDGRLVATIRARGVSMMGIDPASGRQWPIATGCSASLAPDGRRVTNNQGNHRTLAIRDFASGALLGSVDAPPGLAFDNQFWSNRDGWLASKSEGAFADIFVHDVEANMAVRVTFCRDADRPDLFVETLKP